MGWKALKSRKSSFKFTLLVLLVMLITGYIASSIVQSTFAANLYKEPNVVIKINSDRSISQYGSLFGQELLYPSSIQDVEKGIGSITGIIRIENKYDDVYINRIGIGLKKEEMTAQNSYPKDEIYNSFLDNIKLKIEKGELLFFDKTLADYMSLRNFLYDLDSKDHRGLEINPELRIRKNQTIDLKYTLYMVEEAGNELQGITANMPIYINIAGIHERDNDDNDDYVPEDPKKDIEGDTKTASDGGKHWAHDCIITLLNHGIIIGYPHDEMTIEDYRNGTVDPVVFVWEVVQPDKYITRAEAAVLVGRALGLEEVDSIFTGYIDPIPRWARGYVISTTRASIFKGYPGKLFRPNRYITREEMIAVLTRAFEIYLEDKNLELTFKDKDEISDWALEHVKAGYEKEVIVGYPDNTYRPKNYITRAETFTIICKLLGLHNEHTVYPMRSLE